MADPKPLEQDQELEYITCPLCGMNRKLNKSGGWAARRPLASRKPLGSKEPGKVRFDSMNLEKALILQVRAAGSFQVLDGWTLADIVANHENDDLIDQMRNQIHKISAIIC